MMYTQKKELNNKEITDDENFYNWNILQDLEENDEISPAEEGFMLGYMGV